MASSQSDFLDFLGLFTQPRGQRSWWEGGKISLAARRRGLWILKVWVVQIVTLSIINRVLKPVWPVPKAIFLTFGGFLHSPRLGHNRLRMITACFLTKDLLIDWRWGKAYFGKKLLDYELSSNNGGWQWAAGSGCDTAPYFRIFNPTTQTQKFDPDRAYIRRWNPTFQDLDYPKPIVDHALARERTLRAYRAALEREDWYSQPGKGT